MKRNLAILLLILSPLIVGLVFSLFDSPESVFAISVILATVFGVPLIAVTGIIVSFLLRNSRKSQEYSIIGYVIPALLVISWEFGIIQIFINSFD